MPVAGFQKIFLDQVGDDFSVGLGGELVAFFDELLLQREIIFDNAVMNDDDPAGAVAVGVGVLFAGAAVGSPAGVADAVGAGKRLETNYLFEVAQLALGATDLQAFAIAGNRDSGRVIATIFEAPEAVDDDGHDLLFPNVSDNATHERKLLGLSPEVSCVLQKGSRARAGQARFVDRGSQSSRL